MQELLDDIKALRRGIEALNARSLAQGQPISRAEMDKLLATVKEGTTFTLDYKGVATQIQPHLATPDTIAVAVTTGSQQLKQVIDQIPRSMPLKDKVWGFTSVPVAMSMMLLWVGFFAFTVYSWKEKGAAEAKAELLQQQQAKREATYNWLVKGYSDLKRDNPKTVKKYFPQ